MVRGDCTRVGNGEMECTGKGYSGWYGADGLLRFRDCICVPQDEGLRGRILRETSSTSYSDTQLGVSKMYGRVQFGSLKGGIVMIELSTLYRRVSKDPS